MIIHFASFPKSIYFSLVKCNLLGPELLGSCIPPVPPLFIAEALQPPQELDSGPSWGPILFSGLWEFVQETWPLKQRLDQKNPADCVSCTHHTRNNLVCLSGQRTRLPGAAGPHLAVLFCLECVTAVWGWALGLTNTRWAAGPSL